MGFPIRTSQDQSSFDSSPGLFAAYHVLHRLITPRHPPCTLNSLITFITGPERPILPSIQAHDARLCQAASALMIAVEMTCEHSANLTALKLNLYTFQRAARLSAGGPSDRPTCTTASHSDTRVKLFTEFRPRGQAFLPRKASFFPAAASCLLTDGRNGRFIHLRAPLRRGFAGPGWRRPGSNRQPLACKASALPIELRPRQSSSHRDENSPAKT